MKLFFDRKKAAWIAAAAAVAAIAAFSSLWGIKAWVNSRPVLDRIGHEVREALAARGIVAAAGAGSVSLRGRIEIDYVDVMSGEHVAAAFRRCMVRGAPGRLLFQNNTLSIQCRYAEVDLDRLDRVTARLPSNGAAPSGAAGGGEIIGIISELVLKYGEHRRTVVASFDYGPGSSSFTIRDRAFGTMRFKLPVLPGGRIEAGIEGADIAAMIDLFRPGFAAVSGGRIDGKGSFEISRLGIAADIDYISVSGLVLDSAFVDTEEFKVPDIAAGGSVTVTARPFTVWLDRLIVASSGASVRLKGKADGKGYCLAAEAQEVSPIALARFIGGGVFDGFALAGRIDFRVKAGGSLPAGDLTAFELEGLVAHLDQRSHRLDYLRAPFTYSFYTQSGDERRVMIGPSNPSFTPFSQIPRMVYGAVLTAEDAGFFAHRGIEFKEIESAFTEHIAGKPYLRGGSTITQQVAKNLFLSRDRTVARKLREMLLTWELESTLSKARILEIYLNGIEWGPSIFGIGAASQYYFGKSPSALTPLEAAYLAGIIPNPSRYYTYFVKNELTDHWRERLGDLLIKMRYFEYINDTELYDALRFNLQFDRASAPAP